MRIGYRKKLGNGFYVSGSVNSKQISNGIVAFFKFPFIVTYYFCIWPFLKLYQFIKKRKNSEIESNK